MKASESHGAAWIFVLGITAALVFQCAPPPRTTPTPPKASYAIHHSIYGTLTLSDKGGWERDGAGDCWGTGRFYRIEQELVVVTDGSGNRLGTSSVLGEGLLVSNSCLYGFSFDGVPDDATTYTFVLPLGGGVSSRSHGQMEAAGWEIDLEA